MNICQPAQNLGKNPIPCFSASPRGMLTPSFMPTPWLSWLERRWCVWTWGGTLDGAGDCERDDGAFAGCGGPLAQADLVGSCFDADAVEDLLILLSPSPTPSPSVSAGEKKSANSRIFLQSGENRVVCCRRRLR